ncbi:riboflavin kinase [Kineococcus sp. SYSU DK003]|uniref:riboflavin kinase n=1 Tax=Kineococcus sp. SYSU DK003 TaxID=3383124 RepID=UPI003D7CF8E9
MNSTAVVPAGPGRMGAIASIVGVVEHGDKRGRLLGFPTANLVVPLLDLEDGVWAGTVQLVQDSDEGMRTEYVAAVSVGRRPTYYGDHGQRLIEANLLDFDGDLYGQTVLVLLHRRLRTQRRYVESDELVDQLHKDVENVRRWAMDVGFVHLLREEVRP